MGIVAFVSRPSEDNILLGLGYFSEISPNEKHFGVALLVTPWGFSLVVTRLSPLGALDRMGHDEMKTRYPMFGATIERYKIGIERDKNAFLFVTGLVNY